MHVGERVNLSPFFQPFLVSTGSKFVLGVELIHAGSCTDRSSTRMNGMMILHPIGIGTIPNTWKISQAHRSLFRFTFILFDFRQPTFHLIVALN